ncbi:hypothetical protein EE612_005219 [Oryza sativa]|nr:hypothetical protein EE612_005219 [Oryza sativa]
MGRHACSAAGVQQKLRKGLWSPEEDEKLYNHIYRYGVGCWSSVPQARRAPEVRQELQAAVDQLPAPPT